MNMQLIASNQPPYGGEYRITDPLTKVEIAGTTLRMVLHFAYMERKANGVPCGLEFEAEVESWICAKYPNECKPTDPNVPVKRHMTLGAIVTGSRIMLSQWWNGRQVVPREEAERRAKICLKCPFNTVFEKPCTGICAELANVVSAITGAQGTQYDSRLHSCSLCGCYSQAAIWVPKDIQWKVLDDATKQKFKNLPSEIGCWKVEGNA